MNPLKYFNDRRHKAAISRIAELEASVGELTRQRNNLRDEVQEASVSLAALKHQNKMEQEDIKHMVRMKEERLEVEFEQKAMDIRAECAKEISNVKDIYRDKMEENLAGQIDRMERMYGEVLSRLPNIGVKMKGEVGG